MSHFEKEIRARSAVVIFFAVLSSMAAVGTAVVPAIVH
jgi:hypothetical protein